jgi:hypothetical protein
MSASTKTDKSSRKKAKRARVEIELESKKKARTISKGILHSCLQECETALAEGSSDAEFKTHFKMLEDQYVLYELLALNISASYSTRKCTSSSCNCGGATLYCYNLTWIGDDSTDSDEKEDSDESTDSEDNDAYANHIANGSKFRCIRCLCIFPSRRDLSRHKNQLVGPCAEREPAPWPIPTKEIIKK